MSFARLEKAIAQLPKKRGPNEVAVLRHATGANINKREGRRLEALLATEWKTFSANGRRELENITGRSAPNVKPIEFTPAGRWSTGIAEQSALTFVSKEIGFLAIADDSDAIWRVGPPNEKNKVEAQIIREGDGLNGLEGAFFDRKNSRLLVVSEDAKKIWSLAAELKKDQITLGKPKLLGTLADLDQTDNKGWEGITIFQGNKLIAAHEGSPRGLGVFDLDTLQLEAFVKLPKAIKSELADLSDLTVDEKTGHLFLLSDESHRVVEARLEHTKPAVGGGHVDAWSLVAIGSTDLPKTGKGHPKAEGLAFDAQGDLWVSTEAGAGLLKLARQP